MISSPNDFNANGQSSDAGASLPPLELEPCEGHPLNTAQKPFALASTHQSDAETAGHAVISALSDNLTEKQAAFASAPEDLDQLPFVDAVPIIATPEEDTSSLKGTFEQMDGGATLLQDGFSPDSPKLVFEQTQNTPQSPRTADEESEEVGGKGSLQRRCIVTGDVLTQDQMVRFVIGPNLEVTPDINCVLPGRGYWVTARYGVLRKALENESFKRAARRAVNVSPGLIDQVVTLSRRACLNSLGLARRAWSLDCGYPLVRQALISGKAGVVLVASNAPPEFTLKIENVRSNIPVFTLFTTAELSQSLGRVNLAYVSVNKGQWTTRLMLECIRLMNVSNLNTAVQ